MRNLFEFQRNRRRCFSRDPHLFEIYGRDRFCQEDPYLIKLDEAVKRAKMNADWRREYMLYEWNWPVRRYYPERKE